MMVLLKRDMQNVIDDYQKYIKSAPVSNSDW